MFRLVAIAVFLILLTVDMVVVIATKQKARSDHKSLSLPYYVSRVLLTVLVLAGIWQLLSIIRFLHTPTHINNEAATAEAKALLGRAGGLGEVEEEARRVFAIMGKGDATVIQLDQLRQYPAITSLGDMDGIQPATAEMPAHIRILAGNHFHGFRFALCNPGDKQKPVPSSHLIKISDSIYISN